jgi:hypothetical protein
MGKCNCDPPDLGPYGELIVAVASVVFLGVLSLVIWWLNKYH